MDLGRPVARHFARRPHESDDPAVSTTDPDLSTGPGPVTRQTEEKAVDVAPQAERDTPPFGHFGT